MHVLRGVRMGHQCERVRVHGETSERGCLCQPQTQSDSAPIRLLYCLDSFSVIEDAEVASFCHVD